MIFEAPQIIFLVLVILGLGVHLAKHGEHHTETYNFWTKLFFLAIELLILKWGGFFG